MENSLLRSKFKQLGIPKISEFVKSVNSCLHAENWRRMLNDDSKVDTRTLLIMGAELDLNPHELRSVLLARGEKVIAGLIAPVVLTQTEQRLIDAFRRLDGDARKMRIMTEVCDAMGWEASRKYIKAK